MVDFIVGPVSPVRGEQQGVEARHGEPVQGVVLAVRNSRRHASDGTAPERRQAPGRRDPAGAQVLTILIPDGSAVPRDLAGGNYRVVVRFVCRKTPTE